MSRKRIVKWLTGVAVLTLGVVASGTVEAGPWRRVTPQGDLFYNMYSDGPATPAKLYVSPLPAPEWVGHTYFTYQPLMPHEWLSPHARRYVRFSGHPLPVNYTRVEMW